MLRTFRKSVVFAAALFASCCFSLASTPQAQAQQHRISRQCSTGTCGKSNCRTCQARLAGLGTQCRGTQLNCRDRQYSQPELFYNYYLPGTCGGGPAQLYIAPRPVPALVGHTYYTYQPFMPHELLYQHHRSYYRYYDGGRGLTRTKISWYRPPVQNLLGSVRNSVRIAR